MDRIRTTLTLVLLVWLPAASANEAVPVTVRTLDDVLVDREVRAPAVVLSINRAVITSQIIALIDEVVADVGARVEHGDLLVRLDAADARLAVARAEADLAALEAQIAEAERQLARAENLLERDFVSDDELDTRKAAVAVLEANRDRQRVAIRAARLELERTNIRAPFDAVVAERQGQVGSLATPGTPLLTLAQTVEPEVDAEVDPRHAAALQHAGNLRFVSQGREWPVSLARLSSVVEPDTRKQRGRFRFDGNSAPIGSTGDLVWKEDSALVPVALIVQRDNRFGVFLARNGRARFVPIPSTQEGRPAAVDLPRDTLIVVRGHARLQDGDALQITRE